MKKSYVISKKAFFLGMLILLMIICNFCIIRRARCSIYVGPPVPPNPYPNGGVYPPPIGLNGEYLNPYQTPSNNIPYSTYFNGFGMYGGYYGYPSNSIYNMYGEYGYPYGGGAYNMYGGYGYPYGGSAYNMYGGYGYPYGGGAYNMYGGYGYPYGGGAYNMYGGYGYPYGGGGMGIESLRRRCLLLYREYN